MERLFQNKNRFSRKAAVFFLLSMILCANLWGATRTKNDPAAGTYDLSVDFFGSDSPLSNGDDLLINSNDTDGVIIILPADIILGQLRVYGTGTCEIQVRGNARVSQFILGDQSRGGNSNVTISAADGYSSIVFSTASFDTTTYNSFIGASYEKHLDVSSGSTFNITGTWEANSGNDSSNVVINNNGTINVTGAVNAQSASPTTTINGSGSTIITGNINGSGADSFREDVESSPTVLVAPAGTFIWQGGDATNPADWSTAANWVGGTVPNDSSKDVIIPVSSQYPEVASGVTISAKSVELKGAATLTFSGNLTMSQAPEFKGTGTVIVVDTLNQNKAITVSTGVSYECGTLNLTNSLVCSKILVNGETYFNTSGNMYYLVAESSDGITFGDTVTVNAGTNQALLAGNIYTKNNADVNINVVSGMLNHTQENNNHWHSWSENITVKLTADSTSLGMAGNDTKYKVLISADSGDVYFVGTGILSSIDDSTCDCTIHFGNSEDYDNKFYFENDITLNTINDIVLDGSCAGLHTVSGSDNVTLTLNGFLTNYSNRLSSSKLGVNFVFNKETTVSAGTIMGSSSLQFSDVTFKDSAMIYGENSYDNLTVQIADSGTDKYFTIYDSQNVTGDLILKGYDADNKLTVSDDSSGKSFIITGNQINGQYLSIDENGPTVTGGTYYSYDSSVNPETSAAPSGWVLLAQDTYIWQGGVTGHEEDWTVAENWIPQQNPIESTNPANIILPAGRSYYPQINEAVMTAAGTSPYSLQSLKLESGVYFVLPEAASLKVDSLIMEGTSEFQVDGSLTLNGNFTNSRYIYGNGKLIIPSGKTLTVPTGSDDSIVKLKLENSGTVNCAGSATFKYNITNNGSLYCGMSGTSTFEGEYSGTGEFKANNGLTVFKKNADFSNAGQFWASGGEFVFYNSASSEIEFKTKDGMVFNKFYFWGNTNIIVNGSVTAYQVGTYKGSTQPTWNASSNYTSKITGIGTLNIGTGIDGVGIYVDRCSATDGVIGTLVIDTTVNCDSKLETHAGTKLVINEGKSLSVNSFGHKDENTSPKAQVDIKGNLVVTNTMDLSEETGELTAGANQINISSTGKLTAKNIKWTNDASYSNASDTNPFINNGVVEISEYITLPDFSNAPYSGEGKIILNGDSATIQNNYDDAAGISLKNLESKKNAVINNAANCLLKIENFTSPDAANTNTITFGGAGNSQVKNLTSKCIIENNSNLSLETAALESNFTNNGTLKVLTSGSSISSGNLFTNSASGRIISETSGTEAVLSLKTNFTDNGNNSGASSISNDVKILFTGTENQSFTPNTTNDICYTNAFEVDKSAGEFTFAGDFKGSNLSLTDGKVTFAGNISLTDGTDYVAADFATTDDIIISGGTAGNPKFFTAKSIKTAGSIIPLDGTSTADRNSYINLTSTDGNIEIGEDIGASTNYYNTVILDAGDENIIVNGNIYTSNIDVTCNSVDFKDLIYVGGVSIHADDTVSINGLESESLQIDSTANTVKMGGIIKLTGTGDLTIDYPLQILEGTIASEPDFDVVFDVAGNILVQNNTVNSTIGSINSDGDTPRSIKLKAGTGKSIQVLNGNSLNAGFGKVNALDVVQFVSDLVLSEDTTINAATVSFIEDNIGAKIVPSATGVELSINGNFENTKIVTIVPPVVIDGKLTNSGELTFSGNASVLGDLANSGELLVNGTTSVSGNLQNDDKITLSDDTLISGNLTNNSNFILSGDITVSGNFADSGTWTHTAGKSIILNGAGTQETQTFAAKDGSVDYNIVVNKTGTNGVLEFTNAITLTHLDCSTDSYKGKLKFTGTGNQKLVPESIVYKNIEINKVDAAENPASLFTFDGNLSVENLTVTDGSVQFNGNVTFTDGTDYVAADFATTDDIFISDGTTGNPKLFTAKSIKTAGSIIPLDGTSTADRNSYINLTSTDGNIEIGADIGASTNYYNTVTLNAGSKDITVSGNIYTSNIDVTCNSVNFEHLIYVGGVSIHAVDTVSINGLESESLQIDSTAQKIKMGSLIKLTNASNDLIIDYPLQILNGSEDGFNAVFDVAGNILVQNNTANSTIGSINSDGDTPRSIKLKAGTGKSIQVLNGNSTNAGFGNVKALDVVNFQSDLVLSQSTAIKAGTVSFIEDNIGAKIAASATGVELTIDGDLVNSKKITFEPPVIVKDDLTNNDSAEITFSSTSNITGNVTNGEGSTLTFTDASTIGGNLTSSGTVTSHDDITLCGNFTDTGTWTHSSGKSIILNGTGTQKAQTFAAKDATVDYSIVVNKPATDAVVEFTNAITLTRLNCSTNNYAGKLLFTGEENQSFKPEDESTFTYADIEINKVNASGTPAGTFTFTDKLKVSNLSIGKSTSTTFDGAVQIVTLTDTADSGAITFVEGGRISTGTTFNTTGLLTIGSNNTSGYAFMIGPELFVLDDFTHTAGETIINADFIAKNTTFDKLTNTGNLVSFENFTSDELTNSGLIGANKDFTSGSTTNNASAEIAVVGDYHSSDLTNSGTVTVTGAFEADTTVNNGTLTLGTSGKFNGAYSGTGATFTAATGNTEFLADVDLSGTTFNANGGTVIFEKATTVQNFTAKSDASTTLNNVTIKSGTKITTASSFNVGGNWTNENTSSSSDFYFEATAGKITFTKAGTDVSNRSSFAISGHNKFYDIEATGSYLDITVDDENNFNDATFSGENCKITFNESNTFHDATFSGNNGNITFDKSNSFNDALFTGEESIIEFKDDDTFETLTFTGKKSTVKFGANKTQTVHTKLSSVGGTGTGEEILLTTNATTPSKNKSTWWILVWQTNYPGEDDSASTEFAETIIEYSQAFAIEKDGDTTITHDWGASVSEGAGASTFGWFLRNFYWFGSSATDNTSWLEPANWSRKAVVYTPMSFYPPYDTGLSNIYIVKNDSGILNLGNGINGTNPIKIEKLEVSSGATVDLGTCGVQTESIVNNGKIRLDGSQSIQKLNNTSNKPFIKNADSSTVEYYGNCNSVPMSGNSTDGETYDATGYDLYGNIEFTENATASNITQKLKIAGTTTIKNASDKVIKLSGSNIFTGKVTIGNGSANPAGKITLNSTTDLTFTPDTDCTSLEITASSKNVTFEGSVITSTTETDPSLKVTSAKVYTTGTGGGTGDTISGSKIVFTADYENSGTIIIDNLCEITGNLTNSGTLTANDDVTLSGNFEDTGTWNQDTTKSIILNGTGTQKAQTFAAKDATVDYSIVVNKPGTDAVVEFTNAITLTRLNCSTNNYAGKLLFTGEENQSFKPEDESTFTYADIEINKVNASGTPAGTFTFTDKLKVSNLSIGKSTSTTFDGAVQIGTLTDSADSGTITFVDGGKILSDTTFNTTGKLTIGSAGDTFAFETTDATPVQKNVVHTAGETEITANLNAKNATFNKITNSGSLDVTEKFTSSELTNTGTVTVTGAFEADTTVNNGTLTLGTSGKFNGAYSGTGATFTAATGNTEFLADVDLSGTTFNANGGTVIFEKATTVQNFTAKSDASTTLNNVTIKSGTKLTTASNFNVSGNWTNENTSSSSDFYFEATAGKIIFTTAGTDASNRSSFTISGHNKFYDIEATGDFASLIVDDKNNFHDATFSGNNGNITFDKSNSFNDALFTGEESIIEFKDDDTFETLTFTGKKSTVKFGANKIQTVHTKLSSVGGTGTDEEILLTTNAASHTISNKETWWTLYWVNNYPLEDDEELPYFVYTKIDYSTAIAGTAKDKNLEHDWGATVTENVGASTAGWFLRQFYWFGKDTTDNTSWLKPANWSRKPDDYKPMSFYPPYDTGLSNITIAENSTGILNLGSGINGLGANSTNPIKIEKLEVYSGATVDLGTSCINVTKIINEGKIRLDGSQSIQKLNNTSNKPFIKNADSSTVEYYGNCNSVPMSGNYVDGETYDATGYDLYGNIEFTENATASDISQNLKIAGTTTITNASDKVIKLSGENIFTGKITIGNGSANPAGTITLNSAADLIFTADLDCTNLTITADSKNITFEGSVTTTSNLSIAANNITILGNTNSDEITITNSGIFQTADGKSLTYGSNFEQNGTARNELGGSFTGSGDAAFATDVVLYGQHTSDVEFSAGANKQILTQNDLLIAIASSRKLNLNNFASSKVLAKNIVLYSGDVTVDGILSSADQTGDIILLGENYSLKDNQTNIETEYAYEQTRLTSTKYSLNSNITEFTTLAGNAGHFGGKVTVEGGATIHAGQNFYANGLAITGTGSWTLETRRTDDAAISFAEAYNCEISNSKASCWETEYTSTVQKIAAYDCRDNSGNTNWDFDDFIITKAYTVRDNVVCIEFSSPIRNLHGEINGKSGKADDTNPSPTQRIPFFTYSDNDNQKSYSGIYSDPDCQNEISGDIEATSGVSKLYLKAADNSSWNTDATGKSAGTNASTNRAGEHKNVVPFIDIPRAMSGSNYIITNKWGKRLTNYSTRTPLAGIAFGSTADTVNEVEDKTGPVLYSVKTGQELHSAYDSSTGAASEHSYDAHNFIEFRYSEKVNFNNDDALNLDPLTAENVPVTENFGAIKESITTAGSLSFAGLGKIENGLIHTGKNGTTDKLVNALYRKDAYSICVSIAGLVDGTVTDGNNYTYNNWVGYIEKAQMPTGTVTFLVDSDKNNNFVKDYEGNCQIEYPAASLNTIPTVNSTESGLYGKWDISEPIFAINRRNKNFLWNESLFGDVYESEAIGNTSGVGSTLDKIEFHVYDNTPEFGTNAPEWFSEVGWTIAGSEGNKSELYKDYTYAADIFGGARQFDSNESRRTSGGIRYNTLYNSAKEDAFTFALGDLSTVSNPSINMKFDTSKEAIEGAASLIFMGTSSPRRTAETFEGLYFALPLKETNYDIKQRFTVKYDDSKGYVTDLAGNRLRTQILTTIDRTPPSFDMTICPVGQNEIQLIFVKKLRLSINENPIESINYVDNSGNPVNITETIEQLIPQCFDIVKINDDGTVTPSSDLRIDTSVPAEFKTVTNSNNSTFTYIKLALNRPVTVQDISELYIRVVYIDKYGEFSTDLFTNHSNSRVTFIQDESNNYMQMYTAHPLSDFAVGVINPLYAYDTEMVDDEGKIISDGIMHKNLTDDVDSESWAVHDWNANQNNYGTLPAKRQVAIVADTADGTQTNETAPVNFRIYLSNNPDNGSVSTQINKDMKPANSADGTWNDWRIWLPNVTSDVLKSLSEKNNENWKSTDSQLLSADKNNRLIFNIDKAITDTWQAGNQISFLFGLTDDEGNPIKIMHAPELDVDHDKQYLPTSTKSPLYALRQTKADDMMSLDLWSFKLKSQVNQRGGVTILNNVIDSNAAEKVVVKVDVPKEGKLNVLVMTLDGNIVDYLHRGVETSGEHFYSWDGSNRNGNPVARGMYFVRVVGDGIDETRKVMVIKE